MHPPTPHLQGGFLIYLAIAPDDPLKRYGLRGPGIAWMPLEIRGRLLGLMAGCVTSQVLAHVAASRLAHYLHGAWRNYHAQR